VQREQIICFGGLKVINQEGKDISLKFSPKIKQLFVLILLHSIGEEKGISSKKINDYLWPGMSAPRAKNIRGTNIQNMKTLMASCTGVKLVFEDKLWKLEFSDDCFVDVLFVEKAISRVSFIPESDNSVVQLTELLQILKKGQLLPTIEESWIDPFVDKMSDRIIEFGLGIFRSHAHEKYDTVLLDAAEVISLNDPLNEVALRQKVNILIRQGKLSLAHSIFDNFTRLYFELYQEKYTSDFKSLVDRNHHPVEE
jgi:two-component SAPR family response regulator